MDYYVIITFHYKINIGKKVFVFVSYLYSSMLKMHNEMLKDITQKMYPGHRSCDPGTSTVNDELSFVENIMQQHSMYPCRYTSITFRTYVVAIF